jgi:hypothetical protein
LEQWIKDNNLDRADYPILHDIPEIYPSLKWIWEGFHALSASRQMGMSSYQPLEMEAITSYAVFLRIREQEDREDFLHYIQFLDGIFMAEVAKKAKTAPKK